MAEEVLVKGTEALDKPSMIAQGEDTARVLLFGGLSSDTGAFLAEDALKEQIKAQDLRVCSLHQSDALSLSWCAEAGIDLVSLAALRGDQSSAGSAQEAIAMIGAGETQAMANRPFIRCVNGIRLGFVSLAEQPAGDFNGRADILSLQAVDHIRMLLNQCDHVIVLAHSGPEEGELPLPEWRARYRRFVEAGASIVADSGTARGWEAHRNGLVFYGLGSPAERDYLGLFLSLRRNGQFSYEARALQCTQGTLTFSQNASFKEKIDAQNVLFTDEKAYQSAANEMCKRLYCERETAQKRGVLSLFSPHEDEEAKLLSLLSNESFRWIAMRAIRLLKEEERSCREISKKA